MAHSGSLFQCLSLANDIAPSRPLFVLKNPELFFRQVNIRHPRANGTSGNAQSLCNFLDRPTTASEPSRLLLFLTFHFSLFGALRSLSPAQPEIIPAQLSMPQRS